MLKNFSSFTLLRVIMHANEEKALLMLYKESFIYQKPKNASQNAYSFVGLFWLMFVSTFSLVFIILEVDRIMGGESKLLYHERQRLQFCLLHSLNNLFQEKHAFTRADLDAIAAKLDLEDPNKTTWTPLSVIFKPHHNVLTGNYDINVLISALEERGKRVIWHDRRHGASSVNLEEDLFGIIVNVPVRRYGGLWTSRHWITLKRVERIWYNLDSDLSSPCPFKDSEELKEFLGGVLSTGGEILLVMNDQS